MRTCSTYQNSDISHIRAGHIFNGRSEWFGHTLSSMGLELSNACVACSLGFFTEAEHWKHRFSRQRWKHSVEASIVDIAGVIHLAGGGAAGSRTRRGWLVRRVELSFRCQGNSHIGRKSILFFAVTPLVSAKQLRRVLFRLYQSIAHRAPQGICRYSIACLLSFCVFNCPCNVHLSRD